MGTNTSFPESSQQVARQAFSRITNAYNVSEELNSKEKKKKSSKFTTLRKKFTRARRHSRSFDYGRAIRELTSSWHPQDLNRLIQEYESLSCVKELSVIANTVRPNASTFRHDLSNIFHQKLCTDVDLIYRGACFPAHRAILCTRSPFFRHLLSKYPENGCQVPIHFKTAGVDVPLFASLLGYLYSDLISMEDMKLEQKKVLAKLADELGMPNPIEHDLQNLLESSEYTDAVLVFSCDNSPDVDLMTSSVCEPLVSNHNEMFKPTKHELHCHKAILAARSPFFRNLLMRRAKSEEDSHDRMLNTPTRIVLDEGVIHRRYARVLLHALYQDNVEMSLILRGSASMCSLSEAQAIVAGKGQMTVVDEAMEVYQIGQFLDFPVLSQGCEDIIADHICIENIVSILNWSSEPHGSQWVHRQALNFLREEFLQISHSQIFFDLSKDHLISVLASDFLQAAELDILAAVIKWGEHQLVKRIEDREPNLLSHTTHSVSKKGVKKRDLNDIELKDVLADVMPYVRTSHVIPSNSEVLVGAMRRGLISTPPPNMPGSEACNMAEEDPAGAWIHSNNSEVFQKPRFFTVYYEEVKAIRDEQIAQGLEMTSGQVRTLQMSSIPDTLYMLEDSAYPIEPVLRGHMNISTVDIIAGTIPVPDSKTLKMMLHREKEIQATASVQRAFSQPFIDKRSVLYQVQLRVVREFGLPDSAVEVLQNSQSYFLKDSSARHASHPRKYSSPGKRRNVPLLHQKNTNRPIQPVAPTRPHQSKETSPNSPSNLSGQMPDIAMASSSLGDMRIQEELQLDIGDGGNHQSRQGQFHGPMYI